MPDFWIKKPGCVKVLKSIAKKSLPENFENCNHVKEEELLNRKEIANLLEYHWVPYY